MVYEKWELQVDLKQIRKELKLIVEQYPITEQSASFGGWSVLSATGHYQDGWFQGHKLYREDKSLTEAESLDLQKKLSEFQNKPTELCQGSIADFINKIKEKNLNPQRARIVRLRAKSSCSWHQDAPADVYAVRLHLPIVTNEGCFFEIKNERSHMSADGSVYFVAVNRLHRVVNEGDQDRYHLIMDVTDTTGISQFHRK